MAEVLVHHQPKPFVFVLMPFSSEFDDVYQLGIKAAAQEAGAYAERVDEQIYAESMSARIYNQIAKADVIVADMSLRNPNVFYEVGYAHALGKLTILLTRSSEDIPFDLKDHYHIVYGTSIVTLREQLVPRLRWALDHVGRRDSLLDGWKLEVQLKGHPEPFATAWEEPAIWSGNVLEKLKSDWGPQYDLRFSVINRGSRSSPPITGCYVITPSRANLLRQTNHIAFRYANDLPVIVEGKVPSAKKQYLVDWRTDGIPVGGFQSIPIVGLDLERFSADRIALTLRLIVESLPVDYTCALSRKATSSEE